MINSHAATLAVFLTLLLLPLVGCDRAESRSAANAAMHEGQGQEVSADPQFQITLNLEDGGQITVPTRSLSVYESKPPKPDEQLRPQGFELRGDNLVLAGRLPSELQVAPQRKYDLLIDQPLTVRPTGGGDPTAPSMSKINLDEKVYLARDGKIIIERVFHRKGKYAGVEGRIEVELQQIRLGDNSDPDNREDRPIGDPVKATGTFTAKAQSFPYEQL